MGRRFDWKRLLLLQDLILDKFTALIPLNINYSCIGTFVSKDPSYVLAVTA